MPAPRSAPRTPVSSQSHPSSSQKHPSRPSVLLHSRPSTPLPKRVRPPSRPSADRVHAPFTLQIARGSSRASACPSFPRGSIDVETRFWFSSFAICIQCMRSYDRCGLITVKYSHMLAVRKSRFRREISVFHLAPARFELGLALNEESSSKSPPCYSFFSGRRTRQKGRVGWSDGGRRRQRGRAPQLPAPRGAGEGREGHGILRLPLLRPRRSRCAQLCFLCDVHRFASPFHASSPFPPVPIAAHADDVHPPTPPIVSHHAQRRT